MEALFWCCLAGAAYSYFIYPLILLGLPKRGFRVFELASVEPMISFIISAYNEEARIASKIKDTLEADYSRVKLEIIIASDCSTDKTDEIVRSFADKRLRLVRSSVRRGKEHAQALAVAAARGEILVFSDVATRITPSSLRALAGCFRDKNVGAVSSEDRFVSGSGQLVGEGAYVRYEMWLRRLESKVNSLVGLSGSFFAVRRELCHDWPTDIPSDFNVALTTVQRGYRAVACPHMLGIYPDIRHGAKEYQRKYRTILRGLAGLFYRPSVLNPFVYGLYAFQVWSHKVMRWMVPWFLLGLLGVSMAVRDEHWFYGFAVIGQVLFYALVVLGTIVSAARRSALVRIPYFFVIANLAVAHATLAFFIGKRITYWDPSIR